MVRARRRTSRWAALLVAALTAAGCGTTSSPTPQSSALGPATSPSPTADAALESIPVPTPTPVPTGPHLTWTQALTSDSTQKIAAKLRGGISAAVAFGGGFVLAGSESQGQSAVVWYSPDGFKWQVIDNVPGFADGVISYLVPTSEGLLAVGTAQAFDSECSGGSFGCNPVSPIRLWTSRDGQTWNALSRAATAPFGRAQLDLIVDGPAGAVVFGQLVPAQGVTSSSMVWTSPDGHTWTRAPQFSTAFPTDTMTDLDAGPIGYAAVGSRWVGGNLTLPRRAWHSTDGKTWKLASGPAAQGPTVVLPCASGFFGVDNPLAQASFWTSSDGINWAVQASVVDRPNYPAYVGSGLFSDGSRILAFGSDPFQTTGAWISSDGRNWESVALSGFNPPLDSAFAGSVVGALGPNSLLVTTETQATTGSPTWTIWLGTIS